MNNKTWKLLYLTNSTFVLLLYNQYNYVISEDSYACTRS